MLNASIAHPYLERAPFALRLALVVSWLSVTTTLFVDVLRGGGIFDELWDLMTIGGVLFAVPPDFNPFLRLQRFAVGNIIGLGGGGDDHGGDAYMCQIGLKRGALRWDCHVVHDGVV